MSTEKSLQPSASAPSLQQDTAMTALSLKKRLELGQSTEAVRFSLADLDLGPRGRLDAEEDPDLDPAVRNDQLQEELENLAHLLEKQAMHIIFTVIPQKIGKLDAMYKRDPRFSKKASEIKAAGPLPSNQEGEQDIILVEKTKDHKVAVPSNKVIVELCAALKDELLLLGEYMASLSLWIQLNVPRLSDNTSFSQEVQMELLSQVQQAGGVSSDVLEQFATYFLTRAELVSKCLKYPGIEDYRRAIVEMDEKTYMRVAMIASDLRTLYLTLFDIMSKNLTTLLQDPKATDNSSKMFY